MQDEVSAENFAKEINDPEQSDQLIYDEIDKSDKKHVEIGSAEKTAASIKSVIIENSIIGNCTDGPSVESVEEEVKEEGGRRGRVGAKGKGGNNKSGGKKKKKRKIL